MIDLIGSALEYVLKLLALFSFLSALSILTPSFGWGRDYWCGNGIGSTWEGLNEWSHGIVDQEDLSKWKECLKSSDLKHRGIALYAAQMMLAMPSPKATALPIIEGLLEVTGDSDVGVRRGAFRIFAMQGSDFSPMAVRQIKRGLRDPDPRVRAAAAMAAGKAELAAPGSLAGALSGSPKVDQLTEAIAKGNARIGDAKTAHLLAQAINADSWGTNHEAVRGLIAMGKGSAAALDALLESSRSSSSWVACGALQSLAGAHIVPMSMRSQLRAQFRPNHSCPDGQVCSDNRKCSNYGGCPHGAMLALASLGPSGLPAVPEIVNYLRDVGTYDDDESWRAVGPVAVPLLLQISNAREAGVRTWAIKRLAVFLERDNRVRDRLAIALGRDDEREMLRAALFAAKPSTVRPLARAIFERRLKERDFDHFNMRTLLRALPMKPAELYTPNKSPEIGFSLSGPIGPVRGKDSISLTIIAKNQTHRKIRLIDTDCTGMAADLIIFKHPGWPVERFKYADRMSFRATDSISEKDTMQLRPGGTTTFSCKLQSLRQDAKNHFSGWSLAYWGPDGLHADKPAKVLKPGRYWIRARYRFSEEDLKRTPFLSEGPSKKIDDLWIGETYSNEIVLDVRE